MLCKLIIKSGSRRVPIKKKRFLELMCWKMDALSLEQRKVFTVEIIQFHKNTNNLFKFGSAGAPNTEPDTT